MSKTEIRKAGLSRADIAQKHHAEWQQFRAAILDKIMRDCDIELAKHAKAVADVIKACQEGERNSLGYGDGRESPEGVVIRWE